MTLLISCYFHTFLAYFHITDYCIIAGLILYQFLSRPELLACVQIQINKIKKKKKKQGKKTFKKKKYTNKILKTQSCNINIFMWIHYTHDTTINHFN